MIHSDTLEQIDVATGLIEKYPDVSSDLLVYKHSNADGTLYQTFYAARSSQDIYDGITQGKIASLLGVEGSVHQLLPQYI